MEFLKAMKIIKRMCEGCNKCPLSAENNEENETCHDFMMAYPEKAEEILIKWEKEHPTKTFLMDFLEKHPKARLDDDGTPKSVCPYQLGYTNESNDDCGCLEEYGCKKCWNRPMEE